jgi:tetraacyldisaccharide 4'-kinase
VILQKVEEAIHFAHKKKGVAPSILKSLLAMPSILFAGGVKLRNLCYDQGWIKEKEASLPVISIGNIVAGGSGKTPFTILLANKLASQFRLAILTRGYRSDAEKRKSPLVVSDGQGPLYPASVCGDEAYLLASNLPNVIVISGKNRFLGAAKAKELGAQLILLDDGLQHRQLYRDYEIILVDGNNSFEDHFFPLGRLRDEPRRLYEADLVVLRDDLGDYFSPYFIKVNYRKCEVIVDDGRRLPSLENQSCGLFCGIAHPDRFVKTVEELRAKIETSLFLPDHKSLSFKKLASFAHKAKARGAKMLLCTEKDWVKIEKRSLPLPIGYVKREMYITKNQEIFDGFIRKIQTMGIKG